MLKLTTALFCREVVQHPGQDMDLLGVVDAVTVESYDEPGQQPNALTLIFVLAIDATDDPRGSSSTIGVSLFLTGPESGATRATIELPLFGGISRLVATPVPIHIGASGETVAKVMDGGAELGRCKLSVLHVDGLPQGLPH